MFCTNCGHQIKEGNQFCTGCGNAVKLKAEQSQEHPVEEKHEPVITHGNTWKKPTAIITGVIFLTIIFATLAIKSGVNNWGQLTNREIIEKVKPAVVYIETSDGSGSGMIFENEDFNFSTHTA